MAYSEDGSNGGYTENGAIIVPGAGGFTTLASATGQGGEYVFSQTPTGGGKMEATTAPSGGFVEIRSNTFANNGVPTVDARGTDFEDVLGPNEQQRLYFWERDLGTVTGGRDTPAGNVFGIEFDGSSFWMIHEGDPTTDNYIYEMDQNLNVIGGTRFTAANLNVPYGLAWDGSRFILTARANAYLYETDTDFNVTGGTDSPGSTDGSRGPRGIDWDGSQYVLTNDNNHYIYTLDSNLSVTGGAASPAAAALSNPADITYDGDRYIHNETRAGYTYVLDSGLNVVGGENRAGGEASPTGIAWDGGGLILGGGNSDYLYEFAGSYDFMAGIAE